MTLNEYITITNQRYQTGISREHSYRGDLQHLLQSLLPQILVTNEPAHIDCGAPDYILTRKDVPVGYIEAKDVGTDLASKSLKEQFDRYKSALDNLIFTDYLDFHFYKNGGFVTKIAIGEIKDHKVIAKAENFEQFTSLIQNFAQVVTQSIKSPNKLAQMMAAKAKLMAQVIESALNSDDEQAANTSIKEQMVAFKNILIHDIDNRAFADIYAQTIAYGMFAARYHDPTLPTFSREEAATLIPKSNPFLRKLFQYLAGYDLDDRLVWIVDELVQIFLATDVAAIMRNFGKSTRQSDPIIHFYETFLAEYDAKLRKARGVWYTPEPVVNFIVRAVDELLKTKFNLPQGLADTSKTKVMLDVIEPGSKGKSVKKEKELHRVQILDPATGTGTFLAQVVRHIYDSQFASMQGAWPQYVKEHLIPRLNGFELLMTSYAMAHLKLDMLLTETGYKAKDDAERLRIYLTNSLEEHHPDTGTLFASWLSSEANEANHIKRDSPVMVVMGNPPYSVSSSNKSEWIQKLLMDYKKDLNERNMQPLSDDYIKFIRFGQHYIDKNGEGILAYISNNSFIDGIIHRQMRKSLLESFDEIYILDLHGNAKKKEKTPDGNKDENVFDIMQGVSINLFVKTGNKANDALGKIFHYELHGKREAKYSALNATGFKTLPWQEIAYKAPEYLFIQKDAEVEQVYKQGFSIHNLFPLNSSGIKTHRDHFVIDINKEALSQRIQRFYDLSVSDDEIRNEMNLKDNRDWNLASARQNSKFDADLLKILTYRPFDNQAIYYDGNLIDFGRQSVMRHMLAGDNLGLVAVVQSQAANLDYFDCIYVSNKIADVNMFRRGGPTLFALYTYPDSTDLLAETTRKPNVDMQIISAVANGLELNFTAEKTNEPNTFAPIDLLDYIYAVLHSPNYRETYKEFLKIDFPRMPYPTDVAQFWQLVALGGELRKTHLLERSVPVGSQAGAISYPVSDNHLVIKPRFELHGETGRVYINDTQYFEGVPELAWNFYIGGYQPAQKWLKDRKGRALNFEDILHYQKIIHALSETDRLMKSIDTVFTIH
ncbi:MAG: type ISP restriction/modification enzyme [Methylophilaceae bacterium]